MNAPRGLRLIQLLSAAAGLILPQLVVPAHAQEVDSEIEFLLRRLATSRCEFRRQGQWHTGATASEHLRMKHQHMTRIRPWTSTEEFISAVASGSSMTHQPYAVRCNGVAERSGSEWMRGELKNLRTAGSPAEVSSEPRAR